MRQCLSIFIYGGTNKQFRTYDQTVRQENQNAYYTKIPRWI